MTYPWIFISNATFPFAKVDYRKNNTALYTHACLSNAANLQLKIVTNTTASAVIELSGVAEATTDAKVSETWTIALDSGVRTFSFNSSGQVQICI